MPPRSSSRIDAPSRVQLLSNGHYTVMVNAAGSGYSQWKGFAVTRWREDPVGDGWGSYLLLRDEESGDIWSPTMQPYGAAGYNHAATLCDDHASMTCHHAALATTLDVAVAGDSDLEWRRITLANEGTRERTISLTSYAELVLGQGVADAAHPTFSKMFVQTEWVEQGQILLATRRRRSSSEAEVWAAHRVMVASDPGDRCDYETDRMRFLGRGRTLRHAQVMQKGAELSTSSGCVLDPVFSLRRRVRIAPGTSVQVVFLTALANTRADVLALIQSLNDGEAVEQVLASAKAHADARRTRLGISAEQVTRFDALTAALLYADATYRPAGELLALGAGGPPVLWGCGISGDRPIVLLRIADASDMTCVHELLMCQSYWQAKQLGVDVVLLETAASAENPLFDALSGQAKTQNDRLQSGLPSAAAQVFVLRDSEIPDALRAGLATASRIVLDASHGFPDEAAANHEHRPHAAITPDHPASRGILSMSRSKTLAAAGEFDNGLGRFSNGGRSYVISLKGVQHTPQPWSNVVANPDFGFLVTADGGGYTWSSNSQQNPLTPWPNDPVSDTPHEVLYLRDLESGELWSATAAPIRVPMATYTSEHGKGYSRFKHDAHGIEVDLLQFVPTSDPVKLSHLSLRNSSGRRRRLSITAYAEWALGANGTAPGPFVVTSHDPASGALLARNAWRAEFNERVAFMDLGGLQHSITGDRLEFLGRHGSVERPAALTDNTPLSGRVGAGLAPCGALQTTIDLSPGEEVDFRFLLGEALSVKQAQLLIETYRASDLDAVLNDVKTQWSDLLDTVQVSTPDRAMDIMLNDWLLYQTLACRMWARTAYYQASGAYGFRDQLQDAMALCVARPDLAREHVLRAGARQFAQGDVQHWWLPPAGQGIRTRISDDRIWLAYVAAHYVKTTGDAAVLDELLPFLDGPAIKAGDADAFYQPGTASEKSSLYEHAARAIDSSLTSGAHGLPLMGTGDWNDGMNHVGAEGRGESIWLAWFLLAAIHAFLPYVRARDEQARAYRWQTYAEALQKVLDTTTGWDGQWYRRGYYDDGIPLGSNDSPECRIDVIAQSWSLISGKADPAHAALAMASVEKYLIKQDAKIALLFTPPFDRSAADPGYIKGYPPGIRENGGQYTHGATWSIFAYALLGQGDRATALFGMLNPIRHSETAEVVARYQVEPYVACADVYALPPYTGRGGWTWYTGSAGWLYRAGLEAILGFQRTGGHLRINPCIPPSWPRFAMTYRHRGRQNAITHYTITVDNPYGASRGVESMELDGVPLYADHIPLVDDGKKHAIHVALGCPRHQEG